MSLTPRLDKLDRNAIINGNFDFWQRGTSSTAGSGSGSSSATFLADRFKWEVDPNGGTAAAYTQSRQSFSNGQTEVPGNPTYFWRINNTTQGSSLGVSSYHLFQQPIEDVRLLADKSVTISFYARSTISSKTLLVSCVQHFGTGGSPSAGVYIPGQTVTLTSSWQKFTLTFDIPSISGKTLGTDLNSSRMHFNVFTQIGSTDAALYSSSAVTWQGTGNTDIAQIMVIEGEHTAPSFGLAGKTLPQEFQLCQRYYQKLAHIPASVQTATLVSAGQPLNPVMRASPTPGQTGVLNLQGTSAYNAVQTGEGLGSNASTFDSFYMTNIPNFPATLPAQGHALFLAVPINNSNYLTLDAEFY